VHLIFYGPPNPPQHLEIHAHAEDGTLSPISKKDVAGLIKRMLFKAKPDRRVEAAPGCFIQKESILKFVERLLEAERNVYILDEKGEDLRTVEIGENPVFILATRKASPSRNSGACASRSRASPSVRAATSRAKSSRSCRTSSTDAIYRLTSRI